MSVAIALDGPAGAGKSTIAKRVAKALDYIYVDTGALYRTIGLSAMRRNIEPVESKEVSDMLKEIKVELAFNDNSEQIVLLDGEDVSSLIRTPEVSMTASKISAIPEVRAYLLDLQRDMAKKNNVIMDVPFVNVRCQHIRVFALQDFICKLPANLVGLLRRGFARRKRLYQVVGQIVAFLHGL